MTHKVEVAKDFSPYPGGRYPRHGEGNGQTFRERHLIPYLKASESVEVVFDNAAGFPASFLEEAFGGLVREGLTIDQIKRLLTISVTERENEIYRDEAWQYIFDEASRGEKH